MSVADWNALDWLLAAILVLSMAMGLRRGLVRTILGLVGFLLGFALATWNYIALGDWIRSAGWIRSPATARPVAYLLIVMLVTLGVALVARLLDRSVHAMGLGWMNRMGGAGLGLLRGWMIGMLFLMVPTTFLPHARLLSTSILSPCFFAVAHDVCFVVPQSLLDQVRSKSNGTPQWINRR